MNRKMQSQILMDVIIAHQTVNNCPTEVRHIAEKCVFDLGQEVLTALKKEEEGYDYIPKYGEIIRDYAVDVAYLDYDYSFEDFQKVIDAITLIGAMPHC